MTNSFAMARPARACLLLSLGACAAALPAAGAVPAEIGIPGEKVFPESITSAADGRVIIGSIAHHEILAVNPGEATARRWIAAAPGSTLGVFGVLADDASKTLFACYGSYPGSGPHQPSTLKTFDLQSGRPKASYALPGRNAFCNDIAVGADGTAYVSDSDGMQIDRLKAGAAALEPWAGNGAFGPKGGILDGISVLGSRVIVNALATGKVFGVAIGADGKAGRISELKLSRAIDAPDGMRGFGKDGVLVAESGGKGRLSRLTIRGDAAEVATIKEGYPQGPVSVTVVGATAYVLEGQLDALFEPPKSHSALPFHATAVSVGAP